MAGKKAKKKSSAKGEATGQASPLDTLHNLLSGIPDDVKRELFSSLMGASTDDFPLPARIKPRTKAQREIDRLVQEARSKTTPSEAVPLLAKAEEVARKALGKRYEQLVGQMGDDPAGHTYLDVKIELSQALHAAGQRAEALIQAEEVYRLDSDDPFDARLHVLAGYFDLGRLDDADRLLEEDCPEPWAAWNFGELLVWLRSGERGATADNQLIAAHQHNPYVLSLLLNVRMPDALLPGSIETGEDSEAQDYAAHFLSAWKDTPGAIAWLRDAAARLKLEIVPPGDDQPPLKLSARDYAAMPAHQHATWIVGLHEMGMSQLMGEGSPQNHWLTFAFSTGDDLIGIDLATQEPSAASFWESLVEFMHDEHQSGRPARLLVHPVSLLQGLKKQAAKAKIELAPLENPDRLRPMLEHLTATALGGAAAAASLDPDAIRQAPLNVDEVWEAAVVELPRRLDIAGHLLRPWVALVMSRTSGAMLWHELLPHSPPEGALASAVQMAIARPVIGAPGRPRQVLVRDHDEAVALQRISDEAGFECLAAAQLPLIANAVAHLTEELLGGEREVVLTKSPGIVPADLERFYTAAATYFRAQPWKKFAMDEVIGLDVAAAPFGRRYGLVMGQSGITLGLAIYERLQDIEKMFESRSAGTAFDSFSVMFGEEASISPIDLDAIEQFGWPVATPESYPDALRIHAGPRVETPTAEEIRFLAASLEAIAWLSHHGNQKSTTLAAPTVNLTATRLGAVGTINAGP